MASLKSKINDKEKTEQLTVQNDKTHNDKKKNVISDGS